MMFIEYIYQNMLNLIISAMVKCVAWKYDKFHDTQEDKDRVPESGQIAGDSQVLFNGLNIQKCDISKFVLQ